MNLAQFSRLLKDYPEEQLDTFVQKHIFHGTPYVFEGREDEYFEFRNRIAQKFNIGFHEVFIVGSAKQGFSFHKDRDNFDFDSDIDVAIVSPVLFEEFSVMLRDYQYELGAGLIRQTQDEQVAYRGFLKYFAKGWIRPDMAPDLVNKHERIDDWDGFFKSISSGKSEVGNYKVVAGVFKSYDYLQKYHTHGVGDYQKRLRAKL